MREAVAAGREAHETLLNYRGPERTPWWNEVYLSPVRDEDGRVVQYVGVQHDVTARVEAERALRLERDRARSYLERIEELAGTDPDEAGQQAAKVAQELAAVMEEPFTVAGAEAGLAECGHQQLLARRRGLRRAAAGGGLADVLRQEETAAGLGVA